MNIEKEANKLLLAETLGVGDKSYNYLLVIKEDLKKKKQLCKII